eukprot:gene24410-biopygen13443
MQRPAWGAMAERRGGGAPPPPLGRTRPARVPDASAVSPSGSDRAKKSGALPPPGPDSGAGVARAWRGRGAGYRPLFGLGGAGVARACPVTLPGVVLLGSRVR